VSPDSRRSAPWSVRTSWCWCFCSIFYYCCLRRDLPSFPTRRSSDLQIPVSLRVTGLRLKRNPGPRAGERPVPPEIVRGPGFLYRDRKSTRLNSSHVAISYAVFCLKKKTNSIPNDQIHFERAEIPTLT